LRVAEMAAGPRSRRRRPAAPPRRIVALRAARWPGSARRARSSRRYFRLLSSARMSGIRAARSNLYMSPIPVSRWLVAFRRWLQVSSLDPLDHPGSRSTLKAASFLRAPFPTAPPPERVWESLRQQAWSYRAIWWPSAQPSRCSPS